MFTLLVEMRCNSYCIFCGQREVDEPLIRIRGRLGLATPPTSFGDTRGRYTLETAIAALRQARADGYTDVSLQGGEPTLFPELPALVAEARRLDFGFVGMVTNARKLKDRAFTRALLEAGLDGISVSLLGADAATHDGLAAAPGAFDALVRGLGNVVELKAELGLAVRLSASLITSARSVDQLADEVRLLAGLGVATASVHVVRFDGLADDPQVRAWLRFDLARLRRAFALAATEAKRLGVALHLTDLPLCLHPTLSAPELALLRRRSATGEHHFRAAAFAYAPSPHPRPAACAGCLVADVCPFIDAEYLSSDPSADLRPLTPVRVVEEIDAVLAAMDPAAADAASRLHDLARAVEHLSELGAARAALAPARARVDEALGDLIVLAARRRDGTTATHAVCTALGLVPRAEEHVEEALWSWLGLPAAELARRTGGDAAVRQTFTLQLGPYAVALDGSGVTDGEIALSGARPIVGEATTPRERVTRAIVAGVLAEPLRRARRLRLGSGGLDVDLGDGWRRAITPWRADALQLR